LSLTPEGRAMLEASHARILAHEKKMLAPLSAQERAMLMDFLARIAR
jgi:DNA-binding MarR family transcriptional regulator